MSPLDPIFQVNELPFQGCLGAETPSTYPLLLPLMSRATIIYLNICAEDGSRLPGAAIEACSGSAYRRQRNEG